MKKLLRFSTIVLIIISAVACSGNNEQPTTSDNTGNNNNNTTSQGKGTVTLVCNGQTIVTSGNCNYSNIAEAIVIADSGNNANAVTINMEGGLPTATKTYQLMDNVSGTEHVTMSFTRFPTTGTMYDWETKDGAGSLTLTVEGNKITCSFTNVPMDGSDVYNPDELKGAATCSGTFTLYK
jgi:hypothetical protein